jgi:preprotein translocase subunit SecG
MNGFEFMDRHFWALWFLITIVTICIGVAYASSRGKDQEKKEPENRGA